MGLFSTTRYIETKTEKLVPYEKTVHEHRAPTDQSIEIANEFAGKSKQNIIGNYIIEANTLKAAVLAFIDDVSLNAINIHAKFNLNGKDYLMQFNVGRSEYLKMETGEANNLIIQLIRDRFARELSSQILSLNKDFKLAILKHTK